MLKKLLLSLIPLLIINACSENLNSSKDSDLNTEKSSDKSVNNAEKVSSDIESPEITDRVPGMITQTFYCTDGDTAYDLYLNQDGSLSANVKNDSGVLNGEYSVTDGRIELNIPAIGFQESSISAESSLGFLITFKSASLFCHAVGHDKGQMVSAYYKCPSIKFISGVSYEDNAFQFYDNGMVKRRRWKELTGGNDTLYKESYGIYYIDGDSFYMAFGDNDEERFLSGKINQDTRSQMKKS